MRRIKGFSYGEVAVLLAVIVLLSAIAIPKYSSLEDIQTRELIMQTVKAHEDYFSDHNEYVSCEDTNCERLLSGYLTVPKKHR